MRHGRKRTVVLISLPAVLFLAALLFLWAGSNDRSGQGRAAELAGSASHSTLIVDRNGRTLFEALGADGNKHVNVPLSEIPAACRRATIATEDSRFYSHPGVDPVAIARAVWQNWWSGTTVSGASTLTQQLARNLFMTESERRERTLSRKLREASLAWRLERTHSKDELLALYLNTTYYGHYAVGIESAAQGYFGVHARDLDLAQCALLAGLAQYPSGYNPIENPDGARRRQTVVLELMVQNRDISAADAAGARGERLVYAATPFPIEAPHFVMWVEDRLERILGAERARAGGLRVTTTLDLDWQRQAEAIVSRRLAQLKPCSAGPAVGAGTSINLVCDPEADSARRADNAALVALEPATGAVRAMVGSPDYFDPAISGAVNAALSLRQPGSAIKPLTYAAALDPARAQAAGARPWTAATLIADIPSTFTTREGRSYVPQNYDRRFHGPVTVRAALANSYNIPAVKALEYLGVDALVEQAARLGIPWREGAAGTDLTVSSTPPQAWARPAGYGLALTLGGGEVSLLGLTAAYASFGNGGDGVEAHGISKIETLDGTLLWEWEKTAAGAGGGAPSPQAIDPRVAYLITDILSDTAARLPEFGPGNSLEIGRPAAAKTGTTTDWRDNWTLGYTPQVVAGAWVGNADNTPMRDVTGITGAGPIWHDFMTAVLRDVPALEFPRPDGFVRLEVCADSGLLPAPAQSAPIVPCPNRRFEWFIAGTEPSDPDTMHRQVAIDLRSGGPADDSTPPEYVRSQTFWVLPPEYQAWAREDDFPQPPVSSRHAIAAAILAGPGPGDASPAIRPGSPLILTSPDPNRTYRLDRGLPASAQKLPITVRPAPELDAQGGPVRLLVDGSLIATVGAPDYTAWWQVSPGRHTVQAEARDLAGRALASKPVIIFVQ